MSKYTALLLDLPPAMYLVSQCTLDQGKIMRQTHIFLFEDRMFKGQVMMNVCCFRSLVNFYAVGHSRLRLAR